MDQEQDRHMPHIEVMVHEAVLGRLNQKEFRKLDSQSQNLVKTIYRRYSKRVNAENELRKLKYSNEVSSFRDEDLLFGLLADYAIDLAVRKEEKTPASLVQHRLRLQRLWHEYSNRVLRFSS